MQSSLKIIPKKMKNGEIISILLLGSLLIILIATTLNYNIKLNPKPDATNITIKTPINVVVTYGVSRITEQKTGNDQVVNNSRSFTAVEGRVIINSTITDHKINNTLQVLFDNILVKYIDLEISEIQTSPISMKIISVTASEIETWDNLQNTTHIITFRVPEIKVNSTNDGLEYLWKTSEESIKIEVSKRNSQSYTIFYAEKQYSTENSSGGRLYDGSSASAAIQRAFDLVSPGQTILIKSGEYNLTNPIELTQNTITVLGENGTILRATREMGSIFYFAGNQSAHASGLTLENLIFDCNLIAAGPSIKWVDNSTINRVEVKNTKQKLLTNGLEIQGSTNSIIRGITVTLCTIHNIYGSGIAIEFITDSKISNNTLIDCAQYYPSGGAILANDGCKRITIQNNDISGRSDNDGIYLGTSRSFATECLVSQNNINLRLYGTGGGSKFAGSGIKIYALNSELTGNTINWNDTPYVYGISNWGLNNNIHNNTISNAHVGYGSQRTYYNGGSTVTSNKIIGCDEGMEILQRGSMITGNIITNCITPITAVSGNIISENIIN